jgi:hypothetical protein
VDSYNDECAGGALKKKIAKIEKSGSWLFWLVKFSEAIKNDIFCTNIPQNWSGKI